MGKIGPPASKGLSRSLQLKRLIKLIKLLKNPFFYRPLFFGVGASIEHINLLKNLSSVKTFIDIGSNRGQFALIARHLFPKAKIFCFEPLKNPRNTFNKIFANDENVFLYDVAIGANNKIVEMHVSKKDDSSSILPISKNQTKIFPGTSQKSLEKIKVRKLDSCINHNFPLDESFLKIDVQGYEKETLIGCEALLKKIKYLYIECSFVELYKGNAFANDILEYMLSKSFKLEGLYNLHYKNGIAIQGDFFFVNKKNII